MPCHRPHQSPAKKAKQLLDAPRATGRQSALSECCEFVILFVAQILRIEQQRLSHAFEAVVTRLLSVPGGIERTFPVAGMRFWK